MESGRLTVTSDLEIPLAELSFRASRAGGPGGQHVNTTATRVELVWDVAASPSLSADQRQRIQEKLANRISADGTLALAASGSRSQHRNRQEAIERFVELLRAALAVRTPRRKTRPSRAAKERRLRAKKHRSQMKRLRRPPPDD